MYVLSFFKKGGTIQGGHYSRKYGKCIYNQKLRPTIYLNSVFPKAAFIQFKLKQKKFLTYISKPRLLHTPVLSRPIQYTPGKDAYLNLATLFPHKSCHRHEEAHSALYQAVSTVSWKNANFRVVFAYTKKTIGSAFKSCIRKYHQISGK